MREDFWSFVPSHTFLMLTNHKPVISGTDEGIWRRIRLVPWPVVIPEAERDEHPAERLALEADFVLTWLVKGCLEWRRSGLGDPERVKEATRAYRDESDVVARFLADCCIRHGTAGSTELYQAWQKWCADEGEDAGSQKRFVGLIEARGFDRKRDSLGLMRWHGLGLTTGTLEGQSAHARRRN